VLAVFKYANFAIDSVNSITSLLGSGLPLKNVTILLPIGISFYVFQIFAYMLDVTYGRTPPARNLPELMLYKAWFPQLVSGPIERPQHLIPQLRAIPDLKRTVADRLPLALLLFCEGWLRKMFADVLAGTSDAFFNAPESAGTASAVFGIIAFGLEIYGDFSGYTRMAQGISWVFGVQLMENFQRPYLAADLQEFWRRWHISLSSWFRDYVYIPAGGNRRGRLRMYANIMLTMIVSGLWHGAGWNFVLWGAIHGTCMVLQHIVRVPWRRIPKPIAIALIWLVVFVAWVPFRASNLPATFAVMSALIRPGWVAPPIGFIFGVAGIILADVFSVRQPDLARCDQHYRPAGTVHADFRQVALASVWVSICVIAATAQFVLWGATQRPFIYFQF
jgi:alginate O-acetyltransferase complex protein AlgI